MILLLDTSDGLCKTTLVIDDVAHDFAWQADRTLARDIFAYLRDRLGEFHKNFEDLEGIGVFRGPGSFTGLRISMTVMNTLADSLGLPIVGETGDDWKSTALGRLANNENDHLILPLYGRDANITKPRK